MSAGATPMDAVEIADFLQANEAGVLGLAKANTGYAIPVSYTYDDAEQAIYFRLGYAPDSRKLDFIESSELVTFVVFAKTDGGWTSVMAQGNLSELSTTDLDSAIVQSVRSLDIPFFQVHDRPAADLEFGIVELAISSLDGFVSG